MKFFFFITCVRHPRHMNGYDGRMEDFDCYVEHMHVHIADNIEIFTWSFIKIRHSLVLFFERERGTVKIGHDGGRKDILKPKSALMMMISFKIDADEKKILFTRNSSKGKEFSSSSALSAWQNYFKIKNFLDVAFFRRLLTWRTIAFLLIDDVVWMMMRLSWAEEFYSLRCK